MTLTTISNNGAETALTFSNSADVFAITDYIVPAFRDTTGRDVVSAAIVSGEKTLVLGVTGQSLVCNTLPTKYTPINAKVHQLNMYDGVVYKAKDPLLGFSDVNGNMIARLADNLISEHVYDRVIIVGCPEGGTTVGGWAPRGRQNHKLVTALLRLHAQYWFDSPDVTFRWIFELGQTDAFTTQAEWKERYANMLSTFKGFGWPGTIIVPIDTMFENNVNPAVQAAQAAVVDNVLTFSGPNIDSLTGTTNRVDGTHMTDAGGIAGAALWVGVIASLAPPTIDGTSGSPGGSINMATFTYVDRSWAIDNGKTVTKLWLNTTTAGSYPLKLLRRNSPGNYDVVASATIVHAGGGFQGVTLGTPYAVPNDGKEYVVGAYTSGVNHPAIDQKPRAYSSSNVSGSGITLTEQAANPGWYVLAVGVSYQ